MAFDFIHQDVNERKLKARYRKRVCNNSIEKDSYITVAGKTYLNFSSNDYLGLNEHSAIKQAMQEGADKYGVCASSSSLVTGHHYAHQVLEDHICQWLNKPRCLLFSSGFSANLAIFNALGKTANSHFFIDKLSHASMIDGAYQSKATVKRFQHNNVEQLSTLLDKAVNIPDKLIASEGVFSMDGCQAKITELSSLAKSQQAWLYLDDAHSIGVVGNEGQGSNYFTDIDITMATFGKALATSGAFLACESDLHEYLLNFSRHYIYTTAMSPAIAWATKKSIQLVQQEQWRREKVAELSALFASLLSSDIQLVATQSSIHAIIIGDEQKTINVSEILKEQGFWVTPIRPPTVAVNSSRLRVTICANHKRNQIKTLAESINRAVA